MSFYYFPSPLPTPCAGLGAPGDGSWLRGRARFQLSDCGTVDEWFSSATLAISEYTGVYTPVFNTLICMLWKWQNSVNSCLHSHDSALVLWQTIQMYYEITYWVNDRSHPKIPLNDIKIAIAWKFDEHSLVFSFHLFDRDMPPTPPYSICAPD